MAKRKKPDSDKAELLVKALKQYEQARAADDDELKLIDEDTEFGVGDTQWPEEIKQLREAQSRPCLTINKIPEKIDQIEGDFRQNRTQIKVRAVDSKSDPIIAEIIQGILYDIEYQSQAKNAYDTAFTAMLYGGRGAWRILTEYCDEESFDKEIKIKRITDPRTVTFDPLAQEPDKSDGRFMFIEEWLSNDEFDEKYPNANRANFNASVPEHSTWQTEDATRIAEYFYKKQDGQETLYLLDNGEVTKTVPALPEGVKEEDLLRPLPKVKEKRTINKDKIYWCKLTSSEIIEGPEEWPGQYFPIVLVFGKEVYVKGQQRSRGMVRNSKDLQRMYNYQRSTATEQVALSPKMPFLLTSTMLGVHKAAWDNFPNRNYPYLLFEPDAQVMGAFPQRQPPPQLSTALANEIATLDHEIQSAMGLYQVSLGDSKGAEKSGKAILARQREGDVGAYTYFDNFARALTYSGKVIVDMIPRVMDTERIARIRGEDDVDSMIPINAAIEPEKIAAMKQHPDFAGKVAHNPIISEYVNDLSKGRYDVRVTVGPSYTTQRLESAENMIDLAKVVPALGAVAGDLIVKNLDFQGSDEIQKRLRKMLPPGMVQPDPNEPPAPPPPPDPRMQIEGAKLELDRMRLDIDRAKLVTETQLREIEVKSSAILKIAQAEAAELGAQIEQYKAVVASLTPQTQQQPKSGERQPQPRAEGGPIKSGRPYI